MSQRSNTPVEPTRRGFLKASSVAVVGGALAGSLALSRSAHAAGSDVLKIGLIGCGGRGTGAAAQALKADANVKLTAMGDAFADRLQSSLTQLRKQSEDKVAVTEETCFVGFDAYKQVIDSGVDVVLLCSPPHFRPAHLQAAVAAGKHVFAEKPVAVDAPGVRSVLASAEEAKKKGLSVVSGLCYRYDLPKREVMQRIHDGEIGDILAVHSSFNTGTLWKYDRKPEWSDMEWQMRNWLYFTWLSGDFNVEQHVHSLDKAAWALGGLLPTSAIGLGGRQVRIEPAYGHIYDHHAVVYEYKQDGRNDVKVFSYCRQQAGCAVDVSDYVIGTKGTADVMRHEIKVNGETAWRYRGQPGNMYQREHDELFASIRSGKPINNGDYMANSTMTAILGRMATYTGKRITWEDAMKSQENLSPPTYEWGKIEVPPVAMPGLT